MTSQSTVDDRPAVQRSQREEKRPDDSMIPRQKKTNRLVFFGAFAALAFLLYLAWGFIAPAVDSDDQPVLQPNQELPAPE